MKSNENVTPCFHEIRFHGRGGQGAVSAAALLALAAFEDGFESQAFPKFGSERRGALVEAYVRISSASIRAHNQVYAPDAVVIQDASLLRTEPVLQGLKLNGLILLNADEKPVQASSGFRWISLPASQIGERHIGRPLPNTVLLGALAAGTGWVKLVALEQAIGNHLAGKGEAIVKANLNVTTVGIFVLMRRWLKKRVAMKLIMTIARDAVSVRRSVLAGILIWRRYPLPLTPPL